MCIGKVTHHNVTPNGTFFDVSIKWDSIPLRSDMIYSEPDRSMNGKRLSWVIYKTQMFLNDHVFPHTHVDLRHAIDNAMLEDDPHVFDRQALDKQRIIKIALANGFSLKHNNGTDLNPYVYDFVQGILDEVESNYDVRK